MMPFIPPVLGGYWGGVFNLDLDNDTFRARDDDGQNQSGTLTVGSTGGVSWVGDFQGTNESGHQWWETPGRAVGADYDVKINHLTGGNVLTSGDAEDVWHSLVSSRNFTFSRVSVGGPDLDTSTYDLAFSDDGGTSTIDNVTITIELQELSP